MRIAYSWIPGLVSIQLRDVDMVVSPNLLSTVHKAVRNRILDTIYADKAEIMPPEYQQIETRSRGAFPYPFYGDNKMASVCCPYCRGQFVISRTQEMGKKQPYRYSDFAGGELFCTAKPPNGFRSQAGLCGLSGYNEPDQYQLDQLKYQYDRGWQDGVISGQRVAEAARNKGDRRNRSRKKSSHIRSMPETPGQHPNQPHYQPHHQEFTPFPFEEGDLTRQKVLICTACMTAITYQVPATKTAFTYSLKCPNCSYVNTVMINSTSSVTR